MFENWPDDLTYNTTSLILLKFVPTDKNLPFMDIITSTKSCALDMEHNHEENEAETLRQNVSNILQKNLNLKIKSNLKKDERRALKQLQKNDKIRVHEFDKGCGFAIVTNDTAKEKKKNNQAKQQKQKETRQVDSRTRFRKNFANLEKKTNLQTRLILNYIHPTPFHHVYMTQSKRTNQKKNFPCE